MSSDFDQLVVVNSGSCEETDVYRLQTDEVVAAEITQGLDDGVSLSVEIP